MSIALLIARSPWIDICHVTRYTTTIKTFADEATRDLYFEGSSRRLPLDIARRAQRKLAYLHLATNVQDLRSPNENRLHALSDDRSGQHSIAINDQWRICFRFLDGDAYDVEICDYH